MQRKNGILRNSRKGRNAMAMIMAIAVIVIIATVMALSLALSTQTTKRTTDLYLYEQAAILSHSAAELALLRISQNTPCNQASFSFSHPITNPVFDINISLRYIYTSPSPCTTAAGSAYFNTDTNETNGTVLMDISVSTRPGVSTEPIRYFRRTIQKL
jgi:type II secretory pathway pseudopilin PulG